MLRLITRAGVALSGTPGTDSPAAQRIAAMMSESKPPHLPSARTGSSRTALAMSGSLIMSYPGRRFPPSPTESRSGCSKRTPVSTSATTTLGPAIVIDHAAVALMDDLISLLGARRYHCPTAGPAPGGPVE